MTIDDELIGEALLRSIPEDLDDVLTTIEAYRACVRSAGRLQPTRCMQEQRDLLLECAGYCRKVLENYTATGQLVDRRYPQSGEAHFTFTLARSDSGRG
jgi:hypothetical protein